MKYRILKILLLASLISNVFLLYLTIELQNSQSSTPVETSETKTVTELISEVPESGKSYPLMRVVDGDTIVVGFEKQTQYVRLIGINSPEPNDPGGPECYANEATKHLQEIAQTGLVVLHFDESQGPRDSYGRLLAYVELLDGTDIGEKMVADGYAREYTYNATYERQERYLTAENDAIENELGLWASDTCQ